MAAWESAPVVEDEQTRPAWESAPVVEEQPVAPGGPIIPKSGAQMDSLAAREIAPQLQSGVEAAAGAIPEAVEGITKAQQYVGNPASVISDALTPKPVKDFMKQQLVPTEAVDVARRAAQYPAQTLGHILFGNAMPQEEGALGAAGKFASEQIAAQTTPENIALIAGTEGLGALEKGLAKTAPTFAEALFGRVGRETEEALATTATAKAVEPAIKAGAEPPPVPKEFEIPEDTGAFPGISKGAEDVRRSELNAQTQPEVGGEPNASEITSSEGVAQPEVRTRVGEEAPLRQQGETPEARQGVEAEQAQEVVPKIKQDSTTTAPENVPQTKQGIVPETKVSKIGKSIEAKAVEAKLTQGFGETAGYDPITIKDQAQRATSFIQSAKGNARAVIRGEAPLPKGLRGTSLITAMEEQLLKKPDARLAYELANSPLTSATSSAAQEMRLMAERVPDSLAAKFQEIRTARQEGSRLRGETPERLFQDIRKEVVRQSSKRPTWEAFVKSITC